MYDNGGGNFKRQLETISNHGIFISPHGAGLMNILYMPAQAAVVEMFPYHLDHTLYATLAVNMGVANYPVHSIDGHIAWSQDEVCVHVCTLCLMWSA